MKTIKISVIAIFAVAAFGSSYAFNLPQETTLDTQQWYVDNNGDPIAPTNGQSDCLNLLTVKCAEDFNIVNNQPTTSTGTNIEYMPRP